MASRGRPPHPDILTAREWEVLALLRERLRNAQIGERLGISERTARFHVSEILSKLGVTTREEAATWNPAEKAPWWMRAFQGPLKWTIVAKIAGAGLVVATAGGIALLAWGTVASHAPPFHDTADLVANQTEGMADGRANTWTANTEAPAPVGPRVSCVQWEWGGATNRRCDTGELPDDCFPYDPPTIDEARLLRSRLGYSPDTTTCTALLNEGRVRDVYCESQWLEAGLTEQEEISRLCLND